MPLSLHPLRERNTTPKHKNRFWKILKKFRNLLEIQKNDLPLHPLRIRNTVRNDKRKGSENFWKKIFQKDLVVQKIWLIFAPLSAEKSRSEQRERPKGEPRRNKRNCSYSNILNSVLWSIWAAKSFFHSHKRVISNNTFEIRAKDLKQNIIYTMESLILAQDER